MQAWGKILTGRRPNISVEITKECPLRCPGCYAYGDEHLGGEVTLRGLADYKGDELVKRFGQPGETVEEYAAPYKKGDQKQLKAILAGKANIRTTWVPATSSRTSFAAVEITEKAVVTGLGNDGATTA